MSLQSLKNVKPKVHTISFMRPCATYTYIIARYNSSARIIDLASHTTYVVCVNFIHKWRDLQFKVHTERLNFWENFSWQIYLLSNSLPEIWWEEIAEEIIFEFCFDVWPQARTLALRLINHEYAKQVESV